MSAPHGTAGPTDWTTGERVFAPPQGTLDPDWLVPAVLEAVPSSTPAQAGAALVAAWTAVRAGVRPAAGTPVQDAAAKVVLAAVAEFDV